MEFTQDQVNNFGLLKLVSQPRQGCSRVCKFLTVIILYVLTQKCGHDLMLCCVMYPKMTEYKENLKELRLVCVPFSLVQKVADYGGDGENCFPLLAGEGPFFPEP